MTTYRRGQVPWNKGLTKATDPRVARGGERVGEKLRIYFADPENREKMWKDDVGYNAIHARLRHERKTGTCSNCGVTDKRTQMALIHERATHRREDGMKYSLNLDDYRELCGSCHNIYDRGVK